MENTDVTSHNSEEGVECADCGESPEDVLILTCEHNLCLPCAASNLNRSRKRGENKEMTFQSVVCDICNICTILDPQSATELITLHLDLQQNTQFNITDER